MWGTITEPIGNWSPYVAGANTVASGDTFVKIAWNPEFLGAALASTTPTYGLKIECPDGGCNGLPCSIDPSKGGVGGLDSPVATNGVGNAAFCVVTVPKGKTANIVVFNTGGSQSTPAVSSKVPDPPTSTSSTPAPTSTSSSSSSAAPSTTSTSLSSSQVSSTTSAPASSASAFVGGIFQEVSVSGQSSYNYTTHSVTSKPSGSATAEVTPVSTTSKNEGIAAEGGSAIAGLVVALIAAAALF